MHDFFGIVVKQQYPTGRLHLHLRCLSLAAEDDYVTARWLGCKRCQH
jgi:hypothetical protein